MPTSIGYYDASLTNTAAATASEVPLWGSGAIPAGVGTSLFVTPYSDYGFYETVCTATVLVGGSYQCTATTTYFSNSSLNPVGETDHQHFALFGLFWDSDLYYIGFEDGPNNQPLEGSGDYNDVIIRVFDASPFGPSPPAVPEPVTFSMVGVGLISLALFRLKRNK